MLSGVTLAGGAPSVNEMADLRSAIAAAFPTATAVQIIVEVVGGTRRRRLLTAALRVDFVAAFATETAAETAAAPADEAAFQTSIVSSLSSSSSFQGQTLTASGLEFIGRSSETPESSSSATPASKLPTTVLVAGGVGIALCSALLVLLINKRQRRHKATVVPLGRYVEGPTPVIPAEPMQGQTTRRTTTTTTTTVTSEQPATTAAQEAFVRISAGRGFVEGNQLPLMLKSLGVVDTNGDGFARMIRKYTQRYDTNGNHVLEREEFEQMYYYLQQRQLRAKNKRGWAHKG